MQPWNVIVFLSGYTTSSDNLIFKTQLDDIGYTLLSVLNAFGWKKTVSSGDSKGKDTWTDDNGNNISLEKG